MMSSVGLSHVGNRLNARGAARTIGLLREKTYVAPGRRPHPPRHSRKGHGLLSSTLRIGRGSDERRRFGLLAVVPSRTVSVPVIVHAHGRDHSRCRSRDRARVLPCRITCEHIASSSLAAAGLTSFGPIAAKRLDDVRCNDNDKQRS